MDYHNFISHRKSLVIAPAGYGKTHSLAECLNYTPDDQKQLILTHTHAGIASIKEKINSFSIPSSKYHIETITGFAQKYVLSFYCGTDLPDQGDSKYFTVIIEKAKDIFSLESVKKIIRYTYNGLFVDEYQDCTKSQHQMILQLSDVLPTHILGDPLQGIFSFAPNLTVDFERDLISFDVRETLEIPWRWHKEGNSKTLGESLKKIREILYNGDKIIKLRQYEGVSFYKINSRDLYDYKSFYRQTLQKIINKQEYHSLLILLPDDHRSTNIELRSNLLAQIDPFKQLILLEAIDDKDYYEISQNIDLLIKERCGLDDLTSLIYSILLKLFNRTIVEKWVKDNKLISKKNQHKSNHLVLKDMFVSFSRQPSLVKLREILTFMQNNLQFKTKRKYLVKSIFNALEVSITEKITVYDAMKQQKNMIRRMGRKVYGKCFGTTLLTKGLEFETVVLLDAHAFSDCKHFYVAITRACKKLIIFSEQDTLWF